MDFVKLLRLHKKRYPAMELEDYVKLAYQSEFGPEHLAAEDEDLLQALREEFGQAKAQKYAPAYTSEAIGGGLCRFHLAPRYLEEADLPLLARCLRVSARERGTRRGLWKKLGALAGLAETGELGVAPEALEEFLSEYDAGGCAPFHHSEAYRSAYRPHYRVIDRDMAVYFQALRAIEQAMGEGATVIAAVDGRCAAGKTAFAGRLRELYGPECAVFHMDDYFLPLDKRTPERLAAPGGNVDYERCACELLEPLSKGESLSLRSYDCASDTLSQAVEAHGKRLNVIEGSYALHPALAGYSQVHIFLTCSRRRQRQRLERREDEASLERFLKEWIPLEEVYFRKLHIRDQCDAVVDTSRLAGRA